WAMVSLFFLPCILGGSMHDYFSNGVIYHVPWRNVEKVYFPINEPERHWCLGELQISTGVVTFYDTLGWVKGNMRPWWRNMKKNLPKQLTSYLNGHGVLASKGMSVEQYEIKYTIPNVVRKADDFGDCAFSVPPDTLDLTIVKISYPVSGQGNWSVSNSGVFNKKTLLVSFDMNTHQFEVIDIPNIIIRPLGFSLTISSIRNSLLLSGNVFPPDNFNFVVQLLSIKDGSITSFTVMYTIPSPYFMKLLGFNNQDEPIVEAATCHCRGHLVQVYNLELDSFNNVTQILGNVGSFYVAPYKESIILATYPDYSHYCAG
nr:phospholipase-like protein [Tanacetum cinerariifolium]